LERLNGNQQAGGSNPAVDSIRQQVTARDARLLVCLRLK